jgi:hypothetical protein
MWLSVKTSERKKDGKTESKTERKKNGRKERNK